MVNKTKKEITNDASQRYEFPEVAVEILDHLYMTKKELSSVLVKSTMEEYKEMMAVKILDQLYMTKRELSSPIVKKAMEEYKEIKDSIAFRTLDELAKTGLIVKEEEAGNDAIYSITKKGIRLMEEEAEKHVSIIRENLRSIKN